MSTRTEVQKLREDVREVRTETTAGFVNLNTRIDGLHTRIDTLIDAIAELHRLAHTHDE